MQADDTPAPAGDRAYEEILLARIEASLAALFEASSLADDPTEEVEVAEAGGVEASPELRAVTHRIASQFVEVVALAAGQVLSGRSPSAALDQLHAALDALDRLARAASDVRHQALLDALRDEVRRYEERLGAGRGHAQFRDALRGWLPRYADLVGGTDGERLRRLVEFDVEDVPLFRHLAALRGMGPRRLRRLYAAGLHTVEAIEQATADDMAQVTGLPRALATAVVTEAGRHQRERRQRLVHDLPARLGEFARLVEDVRRTDNRELLDAARHAFREMERILTQLRGLDELE